MPKKFEHFQANCQRNFEKFGSNAKGLLPKKSVEEPTVFFWHLAKEIRATAKEILGVPGSTAKEF